MIKLDLARSLGERMDISTKDADEFLTVFMDVVGEILEKMITHHARILDDDVTRIAWGTINGN